MKRHTANDDFAAAADRVRAALCAMVEATRDDLKMLADAADAADRRYPTSDEALARALDDADAFGPATGYDWTDIDLSDIAADMARRAPAPMRAAA